MLSAFTDPSILGLTFDRKIDVGAFLTFVTLVFGFIGWTFKNVKEWRRDARREAQNGALRLLLKILRERYDRDAGPISLSDLRKEFEKPERAAERRAYCERDFHFKDDEEFEGAIYQLQWESKIDFAGGDRVLFRTRQPASRPHIDGLVEPDVAVSSFANALTDDRISPYDLERLGRLAISVNVDTTRRGHHLGD